MALYDDIRAALKPVSAMLIAEMGDSIVDIDRLTETARPDGSTRREPSRLVSNLGVWIRNPSLRKAAQVWGKDTKVDAVCLMMEDVDVQVGDRVNVNSGTRAGETFAVTGIVPSGISGRQAVALVSARPLPDA